MSAFTTAVVPVNTEFGAAEWEVAEPVRQFDEEPPPNPNGSGMVLRSQLLDANTALSLKVAGVSDVDVQADRQVLVYELSMRFGEKTYEYPPGIWKKKQWVVGFQMAFRLDLFDTDMKVNLAALSLAVEANFARSYFRHEEHGIFTQDVAPVVGELNDKDGLNRARDYLKSARALLADPNVSITPEPYTIEIGRTDEEDSVQAIIFALRGIQKGRKLGDLLIENASKGHDHRQITATYQHITGSFEESFQPDGDHKSRAENLLNLQVENNRKEDQTP